MAPMTSIERTVLSAMASGIAQSRLICQATGLHRTAVRDALRWLKASGHIESRGALWYIHGQAPEEAAETNEEKPFVHRIIAAADAPRITEAQITSVWDLAKR